MAQVPVQRLRKWRKQRSREMVAEVVRSDVDAEMMKTGEDGADDNRPDDRDGVDPEAEHSAWVLRELDRIRADHERRAELEREIVETERRRQMTDEEREADNRRLEKEGVRTTEGERVKYAFMQK